MSWKCPKSEDHETIMVEYGYESPHRYDGVSEHRCLTCGYREGRWCGQELKGDEVEPRFCAGEEHPILEKEGDKH